MSAQDLAASQARTQKASVDDVNRPPAVFSPSVWGDHFLSYASMETDTKAEQRIQGLKEKMKRMLMAAPQNLDLINDLQRLGLSYHFESEIDQALQKIHQNPPGSDSDDLYTAALKFRLLRQQGYKVSCEILFEKFAKNDGKFKDSLAHDVEGLLSLFEAAHLKAHGEDILDEALAFSTSHLESAMKRLSPPLLEKVAHSLHQPFWKGYPRLETWHYLSMYEHDDSHDETLLIFAKLDFNRVQQVHQKELCEITRWWKEVDFSNKLPFIRDRIVECYLWALGIYFEPEYYYARTTLCKVIALIAAIDDIYDAYGKYEELELFNEAVQRWDISAMDQFPEEYMKVCYKTLLDVYTEVEEKLGKDGNTYRIHYAREAMKYHVGGYMAEAKWLHLKYTPTTDEYLSVATATSYFMLANTSIVGMGDIVPRDFLDWSMNNPKILSAVVLLGRLMDDIKSHKFEQNRGHIPSFVECYTKEHGVTEEEAIDELNKRVKDAWMDVNQEWINLPAIARPLLLRILNFARSNEVFYKYEQDSFTHSELVRKDIVSLLVKPLPI